MEDILAQSYGKSPYIHRIIQKATWQHKTPSTTSITQRLGTALVTPGVVKPVYERSIVQLTATAM